MAKLNTRNGVKEHKVVSNKKWLALRKALLVKEKKFTKLRDKLSKDRRALPWVKLEKDYAFQGPNGEESLSQLFDGKEQLIVYHFMFSPEWDAGCPSCSFWADNFNEINVHLRQRNSNLVAISRAPFKKIESFRERMDWKFKWVSSGNTSFNFDLNASFTPEEVKKKKGFFNFKVQDPFVSDREGVSVFYKDWKGDIYHTYSTFARGIDLLNTAYNYLDLTPKGRDEDPKDPQSWVDYHDKYQR